MITKVEYPYIVRRNMKYKGFILRFVLDKAKPTIRLLISKKTCQIKVFIYEI